MKKQESTGSDGRKKIPLDQGRNYMEKEKKNTTGPVEVEVPWDKKELPKWDTRGEGSRVR